MINNKSFYLIFSVLFLIMVFTIPNLFADKKTDQLKVIERGKLHTEVFGCVDCHSPKITENGFLINDPDKLFSGHPENNLMPQFRPEIVGPDKWRGLFTDSMTAWGGPWGISYAANLTPDKETGIGKLSEKNFVTFLNLGLHSSMNRKLMQPMPWKEISALNENDLKAIYSYLKSLKPVKNKVPESVPLYNHENLVNR